MTSKQENKVSMYFTVRTFFESNLAELTPELPILPAYVAEFKALMAALENHEIIAKAINSGYAKMKQDMRTQMIESAVVVIGGMHAFAMDQKNKELVENTDICRSSLEQSRDTDLMHKCETLYGLANGNASAIEMFGVPARKLTAFKDYIAKFKEWLSQPTAKRKEANFHRREVARCIREIDEKLDAIDSMMNTIITDLSFIHLHYTISRSIDQLPARHSRKPDAVITVEPNSIAQGYTIPYDSGRSFKIKNKGTSEIRWGLSSDTSGFTEKFQVLGSKAVSKKASKSLGKNGDNLIFQNTSGVAVTVEILVIK